MDVIGQMACQKHDDMQIVDDILIRYGQTSVIAGAIKSHTDVSTAIVKVFIETIP